jgi:hypothetical protein
MSTSLTDTTIPREERIRRRAEELYRMRGDAPGSALNDWLVAEKEVQGAEEQMIDAFPVSDPPAQRIPTGSEQKQSKIAKAK